MKSEKSVRDGGRCDGETGREEENEFQRVGCEQKIADETSVKSDEEGVCVCECEHMTVTLPAMWPKGEVMSTLQTRVLQRLLAHCR